MITDDSKRRRRGPAPLSDREKRVHTVSVRLNDAELAKLDKQRDAVQMQRGEYLRAAALHRLPQTIPDINKESWVSLSRTAANLNQIAHQINAGNMLPLDEIRSVLDDLRRELIGAKFNDKSKKL